MAGTSAPATMPTPSIVGTARSQEGGTLDAGRVDATGNADERTGRGAGSTGRAADAGAGTPAAGRGRAGSMRYATSGGLAVATSSS